MQHPITYALLVQNEFGTWFRTSRTGTHAYCSTCAEAIQDNEGVANVAVVPADKADAICSLTGAGSV